MRYAINVGAGLLAMDWNSARFSQDKRVIVNDHRWQASSYSRYVAHGKARMT